MVALLYFFFGPAAITPAQPAGIAAVIGQQQLIRRVPQAPGVHLQKHVMLDPQLGWLYPAIDPILQLRPIPGQAQRQSYRQPAGPRVDVRSVHGFGAQGEHITEPLRDLFSDEKGLPAQAQVQLYRSRGMRPLDVRTAPTGFAVQGEIYTPHIDLFTTAKFSAIEAQLRQFRVSERECLSRSQHLTHPDFAWVWQSILDPLIALAQVAPAEQRQQFRTTARPGMTRAHQDLVPRMDWLSALFEPLFAPFWPAIETQLRQYRSSRGPRIDPRLVQDILYTLGIIVGDAILPITAQALHLRNELMGRGRLTNERIL